MVNIKDLEEKKRIVAYWMVEQYSGCEVCEEWKNYGNFKKWYDENVCLIVVSQIK